MQTQNATSFSAPHYGVVEEVSGKNIRISGDWRWLPDITVVAIMGEGPQEQDG